MNYKNFKSDIVAVKEVEVKSYITFSKLPAADFVINPYIGCPHKCIYCYADFMKRFSGHNNDVWGDFVDVKLCATPINLSKIKPFQEVLIGSVTDAYNSYEANYKITRSILEQFLGSDVKLQILTKSKLVTRDIDLLQHIPNVSVAISMNTLNDNFRRQIEPRASSVADRIETLKALKGAGIKACLFMAPIFPEITDYKAIITATRSYVDFYCFENLNLRASYKPKVIAFISKQYPKLNELYTQIFKHKNNEYWDTLQKEICYFCEINNIPHKIYFYHSKIKKK